MQIAPRATILVVRAGSANPRLPEFLKDGSDGYQVEVVEGASAAFEEIAKRRYQAVVVDLDATQLDADLELIQAAVQAPGSPGVLVCATNPSVELAVSAKIGRASCRE